MGLEWLVLLAFVVFAYLVVLTSRGGFFFSAFGEGYDGGKGEQSAGETDEAGESGGDSG